MTASLSSWKWVRPWRGQSHGDQIRTSANQRRKLPRHGFPNLNFVKEESLPSQPGTVVEVDQTRVFGV